MSDLINRADAIEAVEGLTKYMEKLVEGAEKFPEAHTKNYKHDMEQQIMGVAHASQVILELPSAEAEAKCVSRIEVDTEEIAKRIQEEYGITYRWIPCSERLPLVSGEFLVTLFDNDGTWVSTAQWNMTFGGRWQDIFPNDGYRDISNVLAWMPLPESYKESEVKE